MRNQTNPAFATPSRSSNGHTLIELLVALAIGGILTSLAVPAMTGMLNAQRATSTANAFFAGLNLARSEAIKRNSRVVMCKTADGTICSSSGSWDQGWILFHDTNNNAKREAEETVIQQQGPVGEGVRLIGNSSVANYVSYSQSGTAKLTSGAFQAGTFTLCAVSALSTDARRIVLSSTGHARTRKGVTSDCT